VNQVSEILEEKRHDVLQIEAGASMLEAVKRMVEATVWSPLVTERCEITRIITERDYLRRVTVEGRTDTDLRPGNHVLTADRCHAADVDRQMHGTHVGPADPAPTGRRPRRSGGDRLDR
jgi:hypothetical protein